MHYTRYFIGLALVIVGLALLLDNTGLLGPEWSLLGRFWPALLIILGLWGLVIGGLRFRIWPIVVLLLGVGFQLSNLNLWQWNVGQLWPLFIVLAGLLLLSGRLGRRERRHRRRHRAIVEMRDAPGGSGSAAATGPGGSWRAVFANVEERVAAPDFRGGAAESIFGNIELDLRDATLAEGLARLEVNVTFGGLRLRVPPAWRVNLHEVHTTFGSAQQSRAEPAPEAAAGELTVAGRVTFGGLEVSN